jgi:hypothetical protein
MSRRLNGRISGGIIASRTAVTIDKIAVFFHVAQIGEWQSVDREITAALEESGLRERADIFVRNECRDTGLFEFPTLNMLREFAAQHDYFALYLHTKGVTRPSDSVSDWRACMLYWVVHRWRECVEKLKAGYDAVGINVIDAPVRHFQGNFWWSATPFLRRLGPVQGANYRPTCHDQTERHKAEFWLLRNGASVYSPYHHRLNPYITRNPRESYVGKAF